MKISTGISEIAINSFSNNRLKTEKVFLWPDYGTGKVHKIRGTVRRTDSNGIYSKPLQEDMDKVMSQYSKHHREYNSNGSITKKNINTGPGLLFDAIV